MWFDQTGLPWVPLSPGLPQLSTATVYPGMCCVEGTNLSEGRGTALPFELVGAPWLEGHALAHALNGLGVPGVRFRPVTLAPWASKHSGQTCGGVQVHVINRETFRPVVAGLHVVAACRAQAPDRFEFLSSSWEGRPPHFDLLLGNAQVREGLAAGLAVDDLTASWSTVVSQFAQKREPYLLYPPSG